jgi:hypothetical protein
LFSAEFQIIRRERRHRRRWRMRSDTRQP